MAKLTLYHAAPSRSSIVRWMLEEIGEPYELNVLSLMKGEQSAPGYLAVNPMGKVPALKHGDVIITEAAAACRSISARLDPRELASRIVGDEQLAREIVDALPRNSAGKVLKHELRSRYGA